MPHEWVHSWNGKFRRPYDLWTPNFNMVKRDDLLWVYEGLTDYWAGVLTTRSGMWTPDQYHDAYRHARRVHVRTAPGVAGARCRTPPRPRR